MKHKPAQYGHQPPATLSGAKGKRVGCTTHTRTTILSGLSHYFVMDNVRLKFQQKILVFRIILRPLDIVSSKALNSAHIFPKRQGHEVGGVKIFSLIVCARVWMAF